MLRCPACLSYLVLKGWANVTVSVDQKPEAQTLLQLHDMPARDFALMMRNTELYITDGNDEGPVDSRQSPNMIPIHWHVECAHCTTPLASWDVRRGELESSGEAQRDPVMSLTDLVNVVLNEVDSRGNEMLYEMWRQWNGVE